MKACCIIQARTGSTRLPGKVLMKLCGETVLWHVVNRVKRCRHIDDVIIATSVSLGDNAVEEEAKRIGVRCFRGSEEDVLARMYFAAKENNADVIIRTTADCPLLDPEIFDMVVRIFLGNKDRFDYGSNVDNVEGGRTFPRGFDTEVFSFSALEEAYNKAEKHREHVTPYIYTHRGEFRIFRLDDGRHDNSHLRLVVDTPEDFRLVNEVFERLYPQNVNFGYKQILELFEEHPELKEVNRHIPQKHARFELESTGNKAAVFKLVNDKDILEVK